MLRFLLALVLGIGWAGAASANGWAETLFDELNKDLGAVPRGPSLVHPFRIVNNTNTPVHINEIKVSCTSCSSAKALQTHLAPGQETAVLVELDTRRFSGPKTVTVYVRFNQPRVDEVRLTVQANSRDEVSVLPESLSFGKVRRGATPSAAVTVSIMGKQTWQITAVTADSNYVLPQCEMLQGGGELAYKVSASLRPDAPPGKWFTDVWLHTNNPAAPRIRLPLTVEIEAPLVVSPSVVNHGEIKLGKYAEPKKLVLRGTQPFRVVGIQGADAQLSVTDNTTESKNVHVLTVTLQPQQVGQFNRSIRIVTDLPGEETIDFSVIAQVIGG